MEKKFIEDTVEVSPKNWRETVLLEFGKARGAEGKVYDVRIKTLSDISERGKKFPMARYSVPAHLI